MVTIRTTSLGKQKYYADDTTIVKCEIRTKVLFSGLLANAGEEFVDLCHI